MLCCRYLHVHTVELNYEEGHHGDGMMLLDIMIVKNKHVYLLLVPLVV